MVESDWETHQIGWTEKSPKTWHLTWNLNDKKESVVWRSRGRVFQKEERAGAKLSSGKELGIFVEQQEGYWGLCRVSRGERGRRWGWDVGRGQTIQSSRGMVKDLLLCSFPSWGFDQVSDIIWFTVSQDHSTAVWHLDCGNKGWIREHSIAVVQAKEHGDLNWGEGESRWSLRSMNILSVIKYIDSGPHKVKCHILSLFSPPTHLILSDQ